MTLEEIFDKAAGRLPMVPKVVQELLASFERANTDVDEVVTQVSHDQVLSAKVLRLANSNRMSGGKAVASIEDAVVRLGFDHLRLLVVSSGMSGMQIASESFDRKAFWLKSFKTGNLARWAAKLAKLDGNTAYTCGLLHNIGELLIHIAAPGEMAKIDRMVVAGTDRAQVENMVLGVDLAMVGGELARRWQFPVNIQRAITQHPNPAAHEQFEPYAGLVALASLLAAQFDAELSDADIAEMLPAKLLDKLAITPTEMVDELPKARASCEGLQELL
ncbi:HDOD domain-containing protein [Chitinimonas sp. BJB300]|uniref:HDOD domain-containing protein n=1 Tax=Chitinimonas sp. BJB300 TaxID=1559339 RepID=UPI000C0D522F|nr:HDOD domain-containing protein [Chitinimonas sp. BJB300]PHV12511.1 HDOD domain-containing protein [Chitinimonas sp. BJB300]TSJ91139.1 HDOD domain-containing protein [Chitinimonas sp. BJB300]